MDKRPFLLTLLDPFDIGGLIAGKDKGPKFWEEADSNHNGHAREDGAMLPDGRAVGTKV